jgi:uncharacterized membrane protein
MTGARDVIDIQETGGNETARVEAFSDGVFAIAITLLALELKVPHLDGAPSSEALFAALLRPWPSYVAFLNSFLTILVLWVNHHGVFRLVSRSSPVLVFTNGLLLLLVTVTPFPTAVLSEYLATPAASAACAFYSGFFVLINVAYNALWLSATRGKLLNPTLPEAASRAITRSFLVGFPCYVAAVAASLWNAYLGLALCVALWVFWGTRTYCWRPGPGARDDALP